MRSLPICTALFLTLLSACSTPDEPVAATLPIDETIRFVPLDESSVEVCWADAIFENGIVSWENESGEEVGQMQASGMTARIAGLDPDESYVVVVRERTSGGLGRLVRSVLGRRAQVSNVAGLEATSLSATSVGLRWTASTNPGARYLVSYRKVGTTGASDTGSSASAGSRVTVNGSAAVVTGLTAGAYDFWVHGISGSSMSTGTMLRWAPATRYTRDAASPGTTIRMYEFASTNGPGLVLDPSKGGPRNASMSFNSPIPPGDIALAIFTGTGVAPNTFDIGPAYAFLGFRNADKFDSSAYVSRNGFMVATLDDLHLTQSLDTYITSGGDAAGNISAFNLPIAAPDGKGVAFLMRVGNGANMHYARILATPDPNGKLLHGTAPNRYVELHISYQAVAGLPYAKGVVRQESVPAYTSTAR